ANQAGNGNYLAAPQVQQSFVVNPPLSISTVVRDAGNKKVHFTGTGGIAGGMITVTICKANSFPCTGANIAGTSVTTTLGTSGNWTSAQDSNNLSSSATYYAQAVESSPSETSSVFTFSTAGL
ncbi:MAG: hypothetical protein ACREEC_09975, partial [Thermoplasmata archaeon]